MTLAPGTIVDGRYRIDRQVGEGGFGVVYAGVHMTLGIPIALKVLRLPEELTSARRAAMLAEFVEEARTLTRLRHDNIVRTLDQGLLAEDEAGNRSPYLVMEWCGDDSLKEMLAKRGSRPMPIGEALTIMRGIVRGVAHAHQQGIAHRDLKPANVMITFDSTAGVLPRIIDFGIVKLFDPKDEAGTGETQTRTMTGRFTPAYAAPEQAVGLRTGPWTDVHALALVLVELLTGDKPYGDDGGVLAIVDPKRPTPASKGVDVGSLEPVIERALALKPADRYRDATELEAALAEAARSVALDPTLFGAGAGRALASVAPRADDEEAVPSRTLNDADRSTRGRPVARPRRGRAKWAAALVGVVGAGAAGALALWSLGGERTAPAVPVSASSAEPPPPPPVSVAPPPTAPLVRVSDLEDEEVWKRMVAAGLELKGGPDPSVFSGRLMVYYTRGVTDGAVYINKVPVPDGLPQAAYPLATLASLRTWIAADRKAGYELAYFVDRNWVLSMSASGRPDPALLAVFDKLVRGLRGDLRGCSWHGPDPANRAADSRPAWIAKNLRELVDFELVLRAEAAGATVSAASTQGRLTLSLTSGTDTGQLDLVVEPNSTDRPAATALLASLRSARRSHAHAEQLGHTLMSQGTGRLGTKAFLDEVIAGMTITSRQATVP